MSFAQSIPQSKDAISIITSAIQKDWSFNFNSIKVIENYDTNSLVVTVEDRYDTVTIEILPIKRIFIGDNVHNYDTGLDLLRIFKTG